MARLRTTTTGTTTGSTLDDLMRQREILLRKMTSGVAEVEQPQLGRTQYRSMDDMQKALAYLDELIAQAGADQTVIEARRRRPIYPVVQEY